MDKQHTQLMPQINFMAELPTMKPVVFNLLLVMKVLTVIVLVLMSYYAYINYGYMRLKKAKNVAEAEQAKYQNLARQIIDQHKKLSEEPKTPPQLTALKEEYEAQTRSNGQIARFSSNNSKGFSSFFLNLSHAMIPGVWFEKMDFQDGGNRITFTGKGVSTQAINEVLERLVETQTYRGRIFSVYRIIQSSADGKGPHLVEFTATTNDPVQAQARGVDTGAGMGELGKETLPDEGKFLNE